MVKKSQKRNSMLTIKFEVNGRVINSIDVVNITEKKEKGTYGKGKQVYLVDGQFEVEHMFEDKALVLTLKVLAEKIKRKNFDNTEMVEEILGID